MALGNIASSRRTKVRRTAPSWPIACIAKLFAVLPAALALAACATTPPSENPLLGVWRYDEVRTLEALSRDAAAPTSLLACYRQHQCGGGVVTFGAQEWTPSASLLAPTGRAVSYQIVENLAGHLLIRDYGQDPPTHRLVLIAPGRAYVERETDGYPWRDYLRRVR